MSPIDVLPMREVVRAASRGLVEREVLVELIVLAATAGSATLGITTQDPSETRFWNCDDHLVGDPGTSSWTITAVRPSLGGLSNPNSHVVDGEFHGIGDAVDDPVDLAEGTVAIDVVF